MAPDGIRVATVANVHDFLLHLVGALLCKAVFAQALSSSVEILPICLVSQKGHDMDPISGLQ